MHHFSALFTFAAFIQISMRKLKNSELNRLDITGFKKAEKNPIVLVLDNIRSLNNIGSIFRTADAFLIEKIYLCGITAQPPHREIHKTALGATDSVDWKYSETTTEAVEELKKKGYRIIALEQADQSIMLPDFHPVPEASYAIVLGNEVHGVEQKIVDLADFCIEIPQFGTKHSFNVTISNGIIIWDILLKMNRL
jgi:tRNA G18 (ribose-2'-O)-methylase SpoU